MTLDQICRMFIPELALGVKLILEAGPLALQVSRSKSPKNRVEFKEEDGRSEVVLKADKDVESFFVRNYRKMFPSARYMVEEEDVMASQVKLRPCLLPRNSLAEIPSGLVVGHDPVDGTLLLMIDEGGWCILVFIMINGDLVGGASFNPVMRGGQICIAQVVHNKRKIVFAERLFNGEYKIVRNPRVASNGKRRIRLGWNLIGDPRYSRLVETLRADRDNILLPPTSCGWEMVKIATGWCDGCIDTGLKWTDCAAGIVQVLAAGKKVELLTKVEGNPNFTDDRFGPSHMKGPIGIIAGSEEVCAYIKSCVVQTWQQRTVNKVQKALAMRV